MNFELYNNQKKRLRSQVQMFVVLQETDEWMGPDWFTYSDVRDYKHIADSFDNAMKSGIEGLRNFSGEEC